MSNEIKLTEYSHGAGCGCKISPKVLDVILEGNVSIADARLLVGNTSRDDAAVYDMGNGQAVISTTDFFMPIVDDPVEFGRVAATNAISDVYAMGGTPLMAIAILGWPINTLSAQIARQVVEGGRQACKDAGISLAGGHSIDAPEPIFGLAVTGSVERRHLKRNDTAAAGNRLYLTKPLGIGILTTAQKQKKLRSKHRHIAKDAMCELNDIGPKLARIDGVTAMTDVTGFGLLGHLSEMCEGSGLRARIRFDRITQLEGTEEYRQQHCIPGGTERNFASYGAAIGAMTEAEKQILCDPQTSGGLLVAVAPHAEADVLTIARCSGRSVAHIGEFMNLDGDTLVEIVSDASAA
ncbi:MAG: selenide, water dikinase SelD [Gammaproteobacteria bacterium]|nr:selenide, water dikinase SelD [Gammaproteobacteria bacterium]